MTMRVQRFIRWSVAGCLAAGLAAFVLSCQQKREEAPAQVSQDSLRRAEHLSTGHQAFLANCAMCHGPWGEGDGPLAPQLAQQGVTRPARLNDRARLDEIGRADVIEVIRRGGAHTGRSNLMPPWQGRLSNPVIADIADFVMTIPDRTPGVPDATIEKYLGAPEGVPADGRKLFVFHCTACHGPNGQGDGMLADTLFARNNTRPRDLTDSLYLAKLSDQDLFVAVSLGGAHIGKSPFMPSWTVALSPTEIKDLVAYVRAISHTASRP